MSGACASAEADNESPPSRETLELWDQV